jgi:hypothetical protein
MITATTNRKWLLTTQQGGPKPRYFKPLVFVNKQMQEADLGYSLDPTFMPPTILQLDECELVLRVNDAQLDLKALIPAFRISAGTGAPTGIPSAGYLPFYLDQNNSNLYVYAGGSWYKTN